MNRWHTARPQWANCICCCIDGKHGSGWLMNLDGAAEQLNRVEDKAALADEIGIAGYRHSKLWWTEWLTAYDALKEQATPNRESP